jgi:hypothetical protein
LDRLLQALVLQVLPQPSLVLHIMVTSGVVDSTTRMSSWKSSSVSTPVRASGSEASVGAGASNETIGITLLVCVGWSGTGVVHPAGGG